MLKPTILYILHSYFTRAGTELHTRDLALGLADRFEAYIAYPKANEVVLVRDDRPVATYPSDRLSSPFSPLHPGITGEAIATLLAAIKPDIIHIQNIMYWPLPIIDQLVDYGRPVVMTHHDYFVITPLPTLQFGEVGESVTKEYSERIFKTDYSAYLVDRRQRLSRSLGALSLHIAPSVFAAREIQMAFPFAFRVVPHGIHPFKVQRRPIPVSIRFGYVGNLIPQKGWQLLLKAFPEVRARHPRAELYLFGWSPEPIRAQLPGLFVRGPYGRSDLPGILGSIDVGIIPSVFKETFGYVLSEMWQAALPVAVADIGALGERVRDGIDGRKFAPGSVDEIREAMLWFLEDDRWKSWTLPKPRLMSDMLSEYELIYRQLIAGNVPSAPISTSQC